jgi:hypothetical protein
MNTDSLSQKSPERLDYRPLFRTSSVSLEPVARNDQVGEGSIPKSLDPAGGFELILEFIRLCVYNPGRFFFICPFRFATVHLRTRLDDTYGATLQRHTGIILPII